MSGYTDRKYGENWMERAERLGDKALGGQGVQKELEKKNLPQEKKLENTKQDVSNIYKNPPQMTRENNLF